METKLIDRKYALNRLQFLCARTEKCSGDVRKKLAIWNLSESDCAWVMQQLIADGFVDDVRFAQYYVRDKAQFSGWGPIKIRTSLRAKGISSEIVEEAISLVIPETNTNTLKELLSRKLTRIKAKSPYELKSKLIRFGVSRGFSLDLVIRTADKLVSNADFEF